MSRIPCFLVALSLLFCVGGRAASLELLSRSNPAIDTAPGSSFSDAGQVSGNGRYVAFESVAGNLTLTPPGQQSLGYYINVYVRDLLTHQTQLVSVNKAGTKGGQGDSTRPRISQDGRFVVFESDADDLTDGDSNGTTDVFVRDLQTAQTKLVSAGPNGQSGDGPSSNATLTPDGRFIAFQSDATNLTADDQNNLTDVFVRDMQTGTLVRASAGAQGQSESDLYYSIDPSLAADGQTVAFLSSASFPTFGVTTLSDKVFIRDLRQDKLAVVSLASLQAAAQVQKLTGPLPLNSSSPVLSADGQTVVFKNDSWVFLYDRSNAKALVLDTNAFWVSDGDDETGPFISGNGQTVVYATFINDQTQIVVWNRTNQQQTIASVNAQGQLANSNCDSERISQDGRRVVFVSDATNLVPGASDGTFQVFLRDLGSNSTRLVSAAPNGGPGASVQNTIPSISADGSVVAFDADDGPLVPNDNNHWTDVFAADLGDRTMNLVSARHPALRQQAGNLASSAPLPALSPDGRRAIFSSWSDNLTTNDQNQSEDLFVYDLAQQHLGLVNAASKGGSASMGAERPVLSASGGVVVFASPATDLTANADTNEVNDLYWKNLDTGEIQLVTVALDGGAAQAPGAGPYSGSASVSQNGQRVAFLSSGTNLVSTPTPPDALNLLVRDFSNRATRLLDQGNLSAPSISPDGTRVLYWKQVAGGPTRLLLWDEALVTNRVVIEEAGVAINQVSALSMSAAWDIGVFEALLAGNVDVVYWFQPADGSHGSVSQVSPGVETTNSVISAPAISGNGGYVVFMSVEPRYYGGTEASFKHVFVRNLQSGELTLVSATPKGLPGNGTSRNTVISQDGRYVSFESEANDLVLNDTNSSTDIFLSDLVEKKTTLVSATPDGVLGDAPSIRPWINAAGDVVLFTSAASNLVPQDYNQTTDVFVVQLAAPQVNSAVIEQGQLVLQFSTRAQRQYRVESTSDVAAGPWSLVKEITAQGGTTVIQLSLNGARQFYRVSLVE